MDADEVAGRIEAARSALKAIPADDLPGRKRLCEQIATLSTTEFLRQRWVPGEEPAHLTAERPVIRVELGGLRLNDVRIAAFPGETFSTTAAAIKPEGPGAPLITVTEHGRTAMYMPPPDQLVQGGYESTCRLVDEGGEPALRDAAADLLRRLNE